MSSTQILITIALYFAVLVGISFIVGRKGDSATFFRGNRSSPWYIVAFGMIGASLSGVTFISVPGAVEAGAMNYFQVVLGYIVGYAVIGLVLMPLYYRMNLTSIYSYLGDRYGSAAQYTGSSFFLLSRIVGASFRLYLVAGVLQTFVFDEMGIDFWQTVTFTVLLIWLYTFRSGIKTIVWTDTLQTLFMLVAVGVAIYFISDSLELNGIGSIVNFVADSDLSQVFFWDDWKSDKYFVKQFLAGAFIAIVMTGLDQDMMQKNLTCRSLKDAQKNIFWFTIVLTIVNFVFLALGVLLTAFAKAESITASKDDLFPAIAINGGLGIGIGLVFLLGLIAAAYSSADSALTSLTTSFSVDIVKIETRFTEKRQEWLRKLFHIGFSVILILVIVSFEYVIKDASVINKLFVFAGYTYGPLLGLFGFGILTKLKVNHKAIPFIAVASPFITYAISHLSSTYGGFEFGFFILLLNGAVTFLGLWLVSLFFRNEE
ncbi:Na+/proline symporter [Nonlabens sp. Hel1_33_55]|uniref:sodium:solute symporter n=1 Tax=Nonlabens sp. Hel1_33_55 TaxID=1336802 RepID=UPI000875DA71|nr:sodium:solute symporter [Nonlabens sp. Hel1_33_55]SCX87118.1 Na+/proline symporter [Nonlabens sp. Hel1_33_55]